MPDKPQHYDGYNPAQTELSERVLLDVWSRLGEYRGHLVLVGGMVPKYLIEQPTDPKLKNDPEFTHWGTIDVDLGISIAVEKSEVFRNIRTTIVDDMGFEPGINEKDNETKYSFVKEIDGVTVNIDFLTTTYQTKKSAVRRIQHKLAAIPAEGLGMALEKPLVKDIRGELLNGRGKTTEKVRICRIVPFVVLKALAFEKRRQPKDAYDLIYVLRNYVGGPEAVGKMTTKDEKRLMSFQHAIDSMKRHFRDIEENGARLYASFLKRSDTDEAQAVAAVREFINAIEK